MSKTRKKIFQATIILIASLFIGEFSLFIHFIRFNNRKKIHADLIAVFAGSTLRVKEGISLARTGAAHTLVVSPANQKKLLNLKKQLKGINCHVIPEPNAVSTCENAYYVAKIVKRNNFKSVILVTSWWHMPRSYLLFRLSLLGDNVEIIPHETGKRVLSFKNLFSGHNSLFSEVWKLWCSIGECTLKKIGVLEMGSKGFLK